MSQKLPVNNFEWLKDTSQFNEDFIKNYNEESDKRYFLEVDVQNPRKYCFPSQAKHSTPIIIFVYGISP